MTKTSNDIIREWMGPSGFVAPFRTSGNANGGGNNDGCVYDGENVQVVNCLGNEAAADVVAAALNLAFTFHIPV